jgi:outer membrane receptor protein involved in Fe transport
MIFAGGITNVYSQGVTTSALSGLVTDAEGEPVFPANVVAIHTPTGTQYGTATNADGIFNIRNMRIGGPYSVTVTFVGYQDAVQDDIYLQLNNTAVVSFTMVETVVQMEGVEILYVQDDIINSDRTGAMTNVNDDQITRLPTIKRSQQDFTRLTPESDGNSFGGRNNLYNNFSLDGSIFNNPFGLDYATPGGQTDAQPVSLDAIEQIQVSLAPFDVREGGFTGAGVNAVTKSGTNEFKGTAYYYFRNQDMLGSQVNGQDIPNNDFSTNLFGLAVGGPIIKNKLFFFLSAEGERRNELAHGFVADNGENTGQPGVTTVQESDIKAVQDRYRNYWGYEPGAYQGYFHETYNNKLLFKLDWNINKKNNLTLRYNMLDSWRDILPHPEAVIGRGPTPFRLPFENSSYRIYNLIHSVVGELNSMFGDNVSNKLLVGYTIFRDKREPASAPFPVNDIFDENGNIQITAGSEMFSTHNRLYQDVFQLMDNVTFYKGRHTITAGVNFEYFKFDNSFNLFYYPWNTFGSVDQFLNNLSSDDPDFDPEVHVDFNDQVTAAQENPYAWSYVTVSQLGIYGQDEFQLNEKVKLTLGLRVDIPFYMNDIEVTDGVREVQNFKSWRNEEGEVVEVDPAKWPDPVPLWAPRFGFNYDVKGDRTIQLRGGTGIFTGRIPFVWLGNQDANKGINPGYTFQVNATAEKFRWPQVWKTNLAADFKVGNGWFLTVEGIYGKDLNAIVHRNYNMLQPTGNLGGTGDNRPMFAGFNEVNIYSSSDDPIGFLDAGTIILDNTNEGHQITATLKVAKKWDFGLYWDIAYNYLSSKDYTSIPAEIAADAFQRNPVLGDPNRPSFSYSRYGLPHRFISSAYYQLPYANNFASTFGLFIEVGKGSRYSYTYAGDLNGDAILNNDLLYVPKDMNDIHFGSVNEEGVGVEADNAAAQWSALDAYINQDNYLSGRRGDYSERHGPTLPWYTQIDFRFMQDFYIFTKNEKRNTIQLSFDILNLGSMLSGSSWGVYQLPTTTTPITVNGVDSEGTPWFSFDTDLKESYTDDVSILSKWQMQIGIRYIFN